MNAKVKKTLELLGFNPSDYENCETLYLLEDVLSNLDEENIVTLEEAECLEYAEAVGLDDDGIAKEMHKNGIDEDVLDIDEVTIEFLQKKLRYVESCVWDNTIDILRKQRDKLIKVITELKEKLEAVNIKSHVKIGEEKWRQNRSELQLLFEEFNSTNNCEDNVPGKGFPFSEKELNEFVELVTQYVKTTLNKTRTDENGDLQDKNETAGVAENYYRTESEVLMQLDVAIPRLNRAQYNSLQAEENIGYIEKLHKITESQPQDFLSEDSDYDMDEKNLIKYYSDLLNLSEEQTQLRVKEKGILHVLDCIKAHRETCLGASKECIDVLQKQQILLDLVYVVKILWDQRNGAVQQTLMHCYEYFHQEVANMKARIACLEEHKKKFKLHCDEQDVYPQKLEMLAKEYFPMMEKGGLQDLINEYENKLYLNINENKNSLIDSKMDLSEIEKDIARIQEDMNFSIEKLSQISLGFSASLETLQARKDEREDLKTSISLCPGERKRSLLWIYFLTNMKKLQDLKDELDPENISPGTPSFVNNFPCFTSTPKLED